MAPSNRTCMLASFLATIQLFTRSRYTCLDAHLSPALLDTCVLHNWVRLFLIFNSCFYSPMFSWDIVFKTFMQPNSAKREEKLSWKQDYMTMKKIIEKSFQPIVHSWYYPCTFSLVNILLFVLTILYFNTLNIMLKNCYYCLLT